MLAVAVYSLMVLIIRDSPWSYNWLRPKCELNLSVFFRYLQQNPKWPEFSNEQLHKMGYVLSVTCCSNMNARRQLVSDLNLEVGVLGVWFKNVRSKPSCDHTFLQMHIVYNFAAYLRVGIIFGGEDMNHACPHPSESPPLQYSPLATSFSNPR